MPNSCAVNDTLMNECIRDVALDHLRTCMLLFLHAQCHSSCPHNEGGILSILHLMHAEFTVLERPCEHTFECAGASTSS
jgi:hypothetical protein